VLFSTRVSFGAMATKCAVAKRRVQGDSLAYGTVGRVPADASRFPPLDPVREAGARRTARLVTPAGASPHSVALRPRSDVSAEERHVVVGDDDG
jgi:hypothetical protein